MIDWRMIPYKAGEPKRILGALGGIAAIMAGYLIRDNMSKWLLFSAGTCMIGMTAAGVFNPVTVYQGTRYGSVTSNVGEVVGQGETVSRQPLGTYYGSVTSNEGNVTGQGETVDRQPLGTYYGAQPGMSMLVNPGQAMLKPGIGVSIVLPAGAQGGSIYPITTTDAFAKYGASENVVNVPNIAADLYGGLIDIRDHGETNFLGG